MRSLPGVEAAATAYHLPGVPSEYQVELKPAEGRTDTEPTMLAQARGVSATYFAVRRIPLLAGEMCRDDEHTPSAVVNRRFAQSYYPAASPIGRHMTIVAEFGPAIVVTGVVGDARDGGLDREPVPTLHHCSGRHQPTTFFLVRTEGDRQRLATRSVGAFATRSRRIGARAGSASHVHRRHARREPTPDDPRVVLRAGRRGAGVPRLVRHAQQRGWRAPPGDRAARAWLWVPRVDRWVAKSSAGR